METQKKSILVIYHCQGGTMKLMAHRLARGAAKEKKAELFLALPFLEEEVTAVTSSFF